MSAFKKLSKSDVTVVPYAANKQWNITQCSYPTSSEYFTLYKGTNVTGSFNPDTDPITNDQYERLVYNQINHLFYQTYSASLNTSSLMFTLDNYESASQQRPTSSYFIYNDNANLIKSFPTGAMNSIKVVAINQDIYGNKVLPNTFVLTSSVYNITDDGFGNLYNYGTTHIGNIFYAHGLAVITAQASQSIFPDPPFALPINLTYTATTTPSFNYSSYVNARDFEIDDSTLVLSGSNLFVDQAGQNILLNTSASGVYETYYKVASRNLGCGGVYSNLAKITITLTKVTDCDFAATATSITIGCDFTLSVSGGAPSPTTASPTTAAPTTAAPTTASPTTASPTVAPTPPPTLSPTPQPTTASPTTAAPTTSSPTTAAPTTAAPTTAAPTTASPTTQPTTASPTTASPTTASPTPQPTTASPTTASPTPQPTTASPTTASPTTAAPTTAAPTTSPTTASPTQSPTTPSPTLAPFIDIEVEEFTP
jgi:hypothetical protein